MVTTGLLVKACRKRKQGCTSKMSFRVVEHAPSRYYASVAQESRVRANAAGGGVALADVAAVRAATIGRGV